MERILDTVCAVAGVGRDELVARTRRGTALRAIAIQAGRALGVAVTRIAVGVGLRAQSGARLATNELDSVDAARLLVIVRRLLDEQLRLTESRESESVPR